jgi:hypothetical protein
MWRKQLLETDDICSEKERWQSKMKPRLRAEEEGRMEVPGLGERDGLEILASCSGRPMMRNSVLDGLRVRRLASIHSEMDLRVSWRREIAW